MPVTLLPAPLQPFLGLSYPVDGVENGIPTTLYKKGPNDILFVASNFVVLTLLRHIVMQYLLSPFARAFIPRTTPADSSVGDPTVRKRHLHVAHRKHEHAVARFAEQGWSMLYFLVAETVGLMILLRIPNPLTTIALWGTYPATPLPWLTKFYYLAQLSWWFHEAYVISIEKHRKDHWQMCFHHVVTISLVGASYIGNYTRIGTLVHTLMDVCDILLPLAKILRYLDYKTACDATFVVFLLAWLCTRQAGLATLIYRTYFYGPTTLMPYKWDPPSGWFFAPGIYHTFLVLLVVLLILCSLWFWMAVQVAVRVVRGHGADDSRSDDEDEGEEDDDEVEEEEEESSSRGGEEDSREGSEYLDDDDESSEDGVKVSNGVSTALNGAANGHAVTSTDGLKRRT